MQKKKETKRTFQLFYAQGNQVLALQCKDITFPSTNDFVVTAKEIVFPIEDASLEAVYIPKHLIVLIKELKPDKKPKLVVLNGRR